MILTKPVSLYLAKIFEALQVKYLYKDIKAYVSFKLLKINYTLTA
jgi:hypothetical protein